MSRDRMSRSGPRCLLPTMIIAALGCALFPDTASALPAWSRRYGAPCATCHYPAPPRLNAYGHKFRRAQYRLEEEFGKAPEWEKLGNYVSFRIRGRHEYASAEDPEPLSGTTESSSFKLNDATIFYAGPVTKNFSGFAELERPGDEGEIEAVVAIGGIAGDPESFWTFRLGQFHTLTRVGWGGLDRPTGISTPDALTRDLTSASLANFSGGTGFKLKQDQVGVEVTYVYKNSRIIAQILNGPDAADSSTTDRASDDNKDKDGLLAYELIWGDTASGLTAFAYRGVEDDPNVIGRMDDRVRIMRYGLTAAQVWENGFEVQGGYVLANDDFTDEFAPVFDPNIPMVLITPGQEDDIDGVGWWFEVEKYWENARDLTVFARYDQTDANTDVRSNTRRKITGGFVWPVAGWHGRWALEVRGIEQETLLEDLTTTEVVGEFMLNF